MIYLFFIGAICYQILPLAIDQTRVPLLGDYIFSLNESIFTVSNVSTASISRFKRDLEYGITLQGEMQRGPGRPAVELCEFANREYGRQTVFRLPVYSSIASNTLTINTSALAFVTFFYCSAKCNATDDVAVVAFHTVATTNPCIENETLIIQDLHRRIKYHANKTCIAAETLYIQDLKTRLTSSVISLALMWAEFDTHLGSDETIRSIVESMHQANSTIPPWLNTTGEDVFSSFVTSLEASILPEYTHRPATLMREKARDYFASRFERVWNVNATRCVAASVGEDWLRYATGLYTIDADELETKLINGMTLRQYTTNYEWFLMRDFLIQDIKYSMDVGTCSLWNCIFPDSAYEFLANHIMDYHFRTEQTNCVAQTLLKELEKYV